MIRDCGGGLFFWGKPCRPGSYFRMWGGRFCGTKMAWKPETFSYQSDVPSRISPIEIKAPCAIDYVRDAKRAKLRYMLRRFRDFISR